MSDQEYIESLLQQNGRLVYENKLLIKENSKLKSKNKDLKRTISKMNGKETKQHYRNGQKRGRTRNG